MKGLTVFIVDDEPAVSDTLAMILNQLGCRATAFNHPQKALEAAPTAQPDVLITDVIMPEINGIELGQHFRRTNPSCKVLLFSGEMETANLLGEAKEQGHTFDIMAKPVHPKELLEKLRDLVGVEFCS